MRANSQIRQISWRQWYITSFYSLIQMTNSYEIHLVNVIYQSVLYFLCLLWFSEKECQKENLTLFWKWVLCDITKGIDSFSRYMTTVSASCLFCRVTSPHSCFFLKEKPSNMGANSVFLLRAVNRWLNSAFWNKTSKKGWCFGMQSDASPREQNVPRLKRETWVLSRHWCNWTST